MSTTSERLFSLLPKAQNSLRVISEEINSIIDECLKAINDYGLKALLDKAKKSDGMKSLDESEKECLYAGLIKLGEALTFCRDEKNAILNRTGIIPYAKMYASARNHFVHHQVYFTYQNNYEIAQVNIDDLFSIDVLEEKLTNLKNCGLKELSKPIRKGANNFPFDYSHHVVCLIGEFKELKNTLALVNTNDKLNSNLLLRVKLDNKIRNILAIMVDLTDEDSINRNNGDSCSDKKELSAKINERFCADYNEFIGVFQKLKKFRNSLCHLDPTLPKPYNNTDQMRVFAEKLMKMEEAGYIKLLDNQFIQKQLSSTSKQDETKLRSSKRGLDDQDNAPESSSTTTEAKRAKPNETLPTEKEKVDNKSAALQSISQYGSDEEKSSEQNKDDVKTDPTQTATLGMGRSKS